MTLKILEYKKEQLYSSHLQEIGGVKFTAREVDVIACILHNRGEKKIAAIERRESRLCDCLAAKADQTCCFTNSSLLVHASK